MICEVSRDAEEAFRKTVDLDRLIDMLRDADPKEVSLQFLANLSLVLSDNQTLTFFFSICNIQSVL